MPRHCRARSRALIVVCTKSPFIWPAAVVKLLAASALRTSIGVTPSAAILSGSSQMRMAKRLPAEDLRVGDAVDRLQPRLHDARQVVGDLRAGQHLAVERQVHQRGRFARLLDHDRVLRLRAAARSCTCWTLDSTSVTARSGLASRRRLSVTVADVLPRGRGERVDALGAGHRLLDRHRDEALDHVGVGAWVGRRDRDRGVGQLGILAHLQVERGAQADEQDEQADDRGSTGRRMKMSVNDMGRLPTASAARPAARALGELSILTWLPLIELELAGGDDLLAAAAVRTSIATRSSRTWPGFHEAALDA